MRLTGFWFPALQCPIKDQAFINIKTKIAYTGSMGPPKVLG